MARQIKKALCIFLSVLMAFSCFAVSAFAYTGYDHNGSNNALRVQTVVSVDKASYQVGDTVTATLTLNHIQDSVIGFQGYVAFDSSVLDFVSAAPVGDFVFYGAATTPTPEKVVAIDPAALTNGYGGTAYTAFTFASFLGTSQFSAPAVVNIAVQNLAGVADGNDDIVTLTFEAKQATTASNIAVVPSNVYSSTLGFLSCYATTSTDGVYASAFSATRASGSFAVTGSAGADTYYTITFTWNGGSSEVSTKQGDVPEAPTVEGYSEGDYDYTFSAWSPALSPATAATTYSAQYTETFVYAEYGEYNAAVEAAIAKRDNGTNWTEESIAALNTELNKDVSGKGRTAQSEVNAQIAAINAAAEALVEKAAEYEIKFVVNGETVDTQTVVAGNMPVAPSVNNYEDNAKTYTFIGWDTEVVAAAGNVTYTAQFREEWKNYTITFTWNGGSQEVSTHWGDLPVAPTVSGYEDASTYYAFAGWTPELAVCAGDASYEATYTESTKTYVIQFVDDDGSVLQSSNVAYGEIPVYTGETPSKALTAQYTYIFAGWDKEIVAVTGEATYTATYFFILNRYTVNFVNEDGTELQSSSVAYGETPVYIGETPTKAADDTYTYTFAGWDKEIVAVTEEITYTATYEGTYINYAVKFVWEGGSDTQTLHWGEMPVAPNVPSYEADGKTYSFANWDKTVVACAGEATYTAQYSSEFIIYSITFVIGDNSEKQDVKAGNMPVAPTVDNYEDGDDDVIFTGWDKEIVSAAGDATYIAQFRRDFVEANYSAVNAAKAQVPADTTVYTDESLAALNKVIDAVEEGLGRTQQDQVNAWAQAILTAISELEYKPADYTAYNAAVEALEAELAKPDYTPDSIEDVRAKLAKIDTELDKNLTIVYQATVDSAKDAVAALVNDLVEKADKEELKSLIDNAKALDADKYVDFTAVSDAITAAEVVYADDNATPKQVSDAIKALNTATGALVFKDADYSQWDAQVERFNTYELRYYQPELVKNVKNVIAQVVKEQDINYQEDLNTLTAQLTAAIDALDIIREWDGEQDFYGIDHEKFYANLEFETESQSNDELVVNVYLNHPSNKVSGIQVAALFDQSILEFKSVEINNGTLYYSNAGDAAFNPEDYGYEAMDNAGVLKFAADFNAVLDETYASRDLIATLHFEPKGNGKTYLKAVPLASNITPDSNTYSVMYDEADNELFMHSEYVTAEFTGIIILKNIMAENAKAPITFNLVAAADNTSVVSMNFTPETDAQAASDDVKFDDVAEGTYVLQLSAPGSLGFTITNIIIDPDHPEISIPEVQLIYGDADGDGAIGPADISEIITHIGDDAVIASDADGDGFVTSGDLSVILLADHLGKESGSQVKSALDFD